MYLEGRGVASDPMTGERLLVNSAMLGENQAYGALKHLYGDAPKCPKDKQLAKDWSNIRSTNVNIITGTVEIATAYPRAQLEMAAIYRDPCAGRPILDDVAAQLEAWSHGPRTIYISVPG